MCAVYMFRPCHHQSTQRHILRKLGEGGCLQWLHHPRGVNAQLNTFGLVAGWASHSSDHQAQAGSTLFIASGRGQVGREGGAALRAPGQDIATLSLPSRIGDGQTLHWRMVGLCYSVLCCVRHPGTQGMPTPGAPVPGASC